MIPASSSRESQPSTTEPELDDLDWPELRRDDAIVPGEQSFRSRLVKPVQWSKDMKSEEEVYLDNLHLKLDRAQKTWVPSTITTEQYDRSFGLAAARAASSGGRRRTDRDDVSIAPSISDDDELEPAHGQQENHADNDNHDGDTDDDEERQLGDVAATTEEPNPADNPGLPLLWNMAKRSESSPRTFSPEPRGEADSSVMDKMSESSDGPNQDVNMTEHVELVNDEGDAQEKSVAELVTSPLRESPPSSPSPAPGLPPGPQHRPSGSTSLYPKPRLLSSDSKVRFSPRVRVKSGLRGGRTGGSRIGSRVGSSASVPPSEGGRMEPDPDDVFASKGSRSVSGHSRLGAMTTLDDPPPSRPTSHRNPSLTGLESTSLTSSASISLCASPPQHSWLFSGNSLSAALASVNGNDDRVGAASGGTDYFSFPGGTDRDVNPTTTTTASNPPSRSSSLLLTRGRGSTLTPRDPEIEKLSADAARNRAESWAREHAARSSVLTGTSGGTRSGGFQTPPLYSPSFETSRRTPSGGILIRTYSGRYLPPSSMNANEVHYKTEQEVIWGSYWDRVRNPKWWGWKLIRGWKFLVKFWCSAGDEDEDGLAERRLLYRRPR